MYCPSHLHFFLLCVMIHRANDDEEEEYRKIPSERESGGWKLLRDVREGRFGVFGVRLDRFSPGRGAALWH